METYKASKGEKVYVNTTFSGLLKGIYLERKYDTWFNRMRFYVKITSKNNPAYKYGEIIDTSEYNVIPRACYHRTGLFRFVVYPEYTLE